MSRLREKELCELAGKSHRDPLFKVMTELIELRLERYKDDVLSSNSDLTRGRATECRDLLRDLRRQSIDTSPRTM